jgi:peptidoglycan/xylan/chitin deacetylase (PgdA/CDA1 family)
MYHQVSPEPPPSFSDWVVSPDTFGRQMRWLAASGYTAITLDTLRSNRVDGAALPRRPVVITFDDGFRDCLHYAAEVLQRFRFTATFFLVAGLVGQPSRWLLRECGLELPLAGWSAIRELARDGFEFGTHSLTHPRLATLPEEDIRRELQQSRGIVEEALGRQVVHLAYPFGSVDDRVRRLALEAGYATACTVEVGLSLAEENRLALRRVPVMGADSFADFVCRIRTGLTVRHAFGRFLRRPWPGGFGRTQRSADGQLAPR